MASPKVIQPVGPINDVEKALDLFIKEDYIRFCREFGSEPPKGLETTVKVGLNRLADSRRKQGNNGSTDDV